MKPILYVSLDETGGVTAVRTKHPTSPPAHGGVWSTYAPANTNLEGALAENERLETEVIVLNNAIQDMIGGK